MNKPETTFDFVINGSGFGGSVSAMRLTEKGYRVLVLERGKRFRDQDLPKTSWNANRYLWMPALRCFGILQISAFKDVFVLHGCGVGGGSLGYANVLMQPEAVATGAAVQVEVGGPAGSAPAAKRPRPAQQPSSKRRARGKGSQE